MPQSLRQYSDPEEKMRDFLDTILNEANREADILKSKADEREKAELEAYEKELIIANEKAYQEACLQLDDREKKRMETVRAGQKKRLLEKRETFITDLHANVEKRLEDLRKSENYVEVLRNLQQKALNLSKNIGGLCILLDEADMKYVEDIRVEGLDYEAMDLEHGGLIAQTRDGRRRIDMSFKTKMEDLVGNFSELTGFKIESYDMEDKI